LHADQSRKGTRIAYVSHLLAVASLVLEDGGTEEEAIAALLHDAIEDIHTPEAEIRARFGQPIAEIVVACSESPSFGRDAENWEQRKRAYLGHLEHDELSESALRVTAADKLHNARSILSDLREHGPDLWSRLNASGDAQSWYYGELARVLADRHAGPVTRELVRVVDDLQREIGAA
jgi:(p)ppGpp synthase/HD superfamily hydrolase